MQKINQRFGCLAICAFPCVVFGAVSATPSAELSTAPLSHVLETFRASLISKDKDVLSSLPVSDGITFIRVTDDKELALVRTKRPDAKKANSSTYSSFVNFIASSHDRLEEKVSNVRIHTDGLVATIYFDYTFNVNDLASNWGHETWGLVNTDDGWKISSIVWSESTDLQKLKKAI